MADNTPQGGSATIATDGIVTLNGATVAEVQAQRVKVGFGSDSVFRDVDAANGLPVVGAFFQATQPVSLTSTTITGSVAVTGGLTDTQLRAAAVPVSGAFFQATQPVSLTSTTITGTVAATKSGAYPLDTAVKGTTAAGNVTSEATDANTQSLHARITNPSLAVTGTFFQATQPVSAASLPLPTGASTETTLAALNTKVTAVNTGAVTISAALPTGANTIGAISNTGFNATLGAETTKVIGTVNVSAGQTIGAVTAITNALPAGTNALGTVGQADILSSGSITTQNTTPAAAATAGSAVELTLVNAASLSIQVTGTYTGALSLQATIDNTNWITVGGTPLININTGGYLASITSALVGIFQAECSGFIKVRITALAAVTGTAVVSLRAVMGASMVALDAALPAGTNIIGQVNGNGTFVVGGTAASGSAVSGNPVTCGGVVRTGAGTVVTDGQVVRFNMSTSGQLNVKPYGMPEADWQYASIAGGIINTTDVVVKAAGAAGIRNYVTGIDLRNAHATVATEVVIKDGATVIWRGHLPAASPTVDVGFATPLRGTAATALNVACITTGAAVYVNLQGYIGN